MRPESTPHAAPGELPTRVGSALLVALLVGVALWLLGRLVRFEYGLDQGIYAAVADVMQEGGAPYRDAWDFKPPGIFFVYALARALLGDAMSSVRILEAAGMASLGVAFALLSRRFVGAALPGLLGGALAISGHVWLGFWHTGQPESFGAPLLAWALVAATVRAPSGDPGGARREAAAWALAGALYVAAASMKPPLGGGLLVSLGFAVRDERRRAPGARALLRPSLAFGGGAAAVLLALGLYFAAEGALGDLYEALFVFTPEYTRMNYRTGDLADFAFRAVAFLGLRFSWLNPLGIALLVALPRLSDREREGALHVLGVVAFVVAGIALQGRFFAYHYGAAVPLLALPAGWGLWKLTRVGARHGVGVGLLAVAIAALLHANGPSGRVPGGLLERIRSVDDGRAHNASSRRVAAWVSAHTAPDDRIHVWGFQPMLYVLADRLPASRFVYNAPQRARWYAARARPALMEELRRDPPALILVESGDVHPGTTGNEMDSAATLRRFPRLARFLDARYEVAATVEPFTIHRLRDAPAPPAGRGSPSGPPDPAASP